MDLALRILGAFILIDLVAALVLVVLVAVVYQRRPHIQQRPPFIPLLGAFLFLGFCSAFIYGGIWMWLRVL
jgi:hypothetical protein